MSTTEHKPYTDDGVAYCGWATGNGVVDGCGEVWPCATVQARTQTEGATTNATDPAREAAAAELARRNAVETVARRVLVHIIAADEVLQKWEDYPEIGEDDWVAVAAEVWRLAQRTDVQTEKYDAAYRFLAGRAEGSPE